METDRQTDRQTDRHTEGRSLLVYPRIIQTPWEKRKHKKTQKITIGVIAHLADANSGCLFHDKHGNQCPLERGLSRWTAQLGWCHFPRLTFKCRSNSAEVRLYSHC